MRRIACFFVLATVLMAAPSRSSETVGSWQVWLEFHDATQLWDPSSLSAPDKDGIRTVRTKTIPGRHYKEGGLEAEYIVGIREVDCSKGKWRSRTMVVYDSKDNVLEKDEGDDYWSPIPDQLIGRLCPGAK